MAEPCEFGLVFIVEVVVRVERRRTDTDP